MDIKDKSYKEIKILTINGHKFVVGLNWRSLKSARGHMKEAKEYGKKNGLDVVAIKKGEHIQAGFAPKQSKSIRGMYSLAVSLVSLIDSKRWIAALPVPGIDDGDEKKYIVIACAENDTVIPWSDVIVPKSEVKPLVDNIMNYLKDPDDMDSVTIYGDDSFIWVTDTISLEDILVAQSLKKDFKLRPLTFGLTQKQLSFLGFGAIACAVGYYFVDGYLENKQNEELLLQIQEKKRQEEINRIAKYKTALESMKHPWISSPSVVNFVKHCDSMLYKLPVSIGGGWVPVNIDCTVNNVVGKNGVADVTTSVIYNKNGESPSTIADFFSDVEHLFKATPSLNMKDKSISSFTLSSSINGNGDDPVNKISEQIIGLMSLLQSKGVEFNLYNKDKGLVDEASDANDSNNDLPKPDWDEVYFDFETESPPRLIFDNKNLNGIRLQGLTYKIAPDSGNISYVVKGVIYGKK